MVHVIEIFVLLDLVGDIIWGIYTRHAMRHGTGLNCVRYIIKLFIFGAMTVCLA